MHMKKIIGVVVGLLFFLSNANALDLGVGVRAGVNGVGINLSVGLSKNVNLRFSGAAVDIDGEEETVTVGDNGFEGDIDAELDFDHGVTAFLLDWHAFNNSFRFTGGMLKNHGEADLTGVLQSDIVIDGSPLNTDDLVGSAIGGEVSLGDSYQPYIGIGWGRGAGGDGGFSFSADLGVALLDPEVSFDAAVNPGGTNGYTQAELDAILVELENDAEDELDDYELWPVLAIGVNYAF
jgi:hypothetical protein